MTRNSSAQDVQTLARSAFAPTSVHYDSMWSLSPTYKQWMMDHVLEHLDLQDGDRLIDIGGGNGWYVNEIARTCGLDGVRPICFEPASSTGEIDAALYIDDIAAFDAILIKSSIHRIKDRPRFWRGVKEKLCQGGRGLVITRPRCAELPLFNLALEHFKSTQPLSGSITAEVEAAGLFVEIHAPSVTVCTTVDRWCEMLRDRAIPGLCHLSNREIEDGIIETREKWGDGTITFEDQVMFISIRDFDCAKPEPVIHYEHELNSTKEFRIDNIEVGEAGPSKIHGIGLFATDFIAKGEVLCGLDGQRVPFDLNGDMEKSREWNALPGNMLLVRAYKTKYSLINHSRAPNLELTHHGFTLTIVALRDIEQGEELTLDYLKENLPEKYIALHGKSYLYGDSAER